MGASALTETHGHGTVHGTTSGRLKAMAGLLALALTWLAMQHLGGHAAPGAPSEAFLQFLPLILSAGQALLNKHKGGGSSAPSPMAAQSTADLARGKQAENAYYDKLTGFNAEDAASKAAGATFTDWQDQLKRGYESLTGGQVASGRINSGYGYQDSDRYLKDQGNALTKNLAALSLQAEGLNLQNTGMLGQYGSDVTGRGVDLAQTEADRKAQEAASKRSLYGNLGGAIINAAGTYLGNKAGG